MNIDIMEKIMECLDWDLYGETCVAILKNEENAGDHPSDFDSLTKEEQYALLYWIKNSLVRSNKYADRSSYGVKHDFEAEAFYISNGQFKGAMLLLGYQPRHIDDLNWIFRMMPRVKRKKTVYEESHRYTLGRFDKEFAHILISAGHIGVMDSEVCAQRMLDRVRDLIEKASFEQRVDTAIQEKTPGWKL